MDCRLWVFKTAFLCFIDPADDWFSIAAKREGSTKGVFQEEGAIKRVKD